MSSYIYRLIGGFQTSILISYKISISVLLLWYFIVSEMLERFIKSALHFSLLNVQICCIKQWPAGTIQFAFDYKTKSDWLLALYYSTPI
jgi:hypothetical protein